ncbi:hypothetical protein J5N97_008169 [Dioscorea zingiberensis]|uniref:Uncharacterized protein n=1 Tax=Dioscorea zingiberensis TaxID=325984 RepID=A0A9D5DFF0_9LILI|nr:hypothetical protein J5N97_008169 [Dioscorea zingiberensis]
MDDLARNYGRPLLSYWNLLFPPCKASTLAIVPYLSRESLFPTWSVWEFLIVVTSSIVSSIQILAEFDFHNFEEPLPPVWILKDLTFPES